MNTVYGLLALVYMVPLCLTSGYENRGGVLHKYVHT